jgi:ABC-type cobalamin/Fe3+-siderophores transport system ATPase subunit
VALHHAHLTLARKGFYTVIGPNGAGKTTLLTAINGLGTMVQGSVTVFGTPLTLQTMLRIRRTIGYVPQQSALDPRLPFSVFDAAALGVYAAAGTGHRFTRALRTRVRRALEITGMSSFARRPIGHLSGGERQKVAIARALAQQPSVLLLDEPTANLDPQAQHELMRIIAQVYRDTGCTVVLVTHAINHIPRICTHAVFIKAGSITRVGAFSDLCTERALSDLYDFPMSVLDEDGILYAHPHAPGSLNTRDTHSGAPREFVSQEDGS